ncbi:MAG: 50S ribosomal protein L24 [Candidatus Firestonebacteria bacterium]|nr:50S ribosomal protein L24 [Candidatus Firestonebacteria bacterium]
MQAKPKLHKNDVVTVISGKDRGKSGKVLKIFPKKDKAIVEKVNFVKRHTRPTQKMPQGGILEKEAPLALSKLKLICNKCNAVTRISFKRIGDNDKFVRVCTKCKEMID